MRIRLAVALLATAFAGHPAYAQAPQPNASGKAPLHLWIDGGMGFGAAGAGPETEPGGFLSGRVALRLTIGRTVLISRTTATTGGPSDYSRGFLSLTGKLRDEFIDTGLLVGYAVPFGSTWEVFGAGGLALVVGSRAVSNECGGFCFTSGRREPFAPRLGLPLEGGLSVGLGPLFHLGFIGYANVNTEETFGGGVVSVAFKVR